MVNYSFGDRKVSFIKKKIFDRRDLAGTTADIRNRMVRWPTRSYMSRTETQAGDDLKITGLELLMIR